MFEMAVRQDVYEERQNQLRWQVKLGDDQIRSEARQEINDNREVAWRDYKVGGFTLCTVDTRSNTFKTI